MHVSACLLGFGLALALGPTASTLSGACPGLVYGIAPRHLRNVARVQLCPDTRAFHKHCERHAAVPQAESPPEVLREICALVLRFPLTLVVVGKLFQDCRRPSAAGRSRRGCWRSGRANYFPSGWPQFFNEISDCLVGPCAVRVGREEGEYVPDPGAADIRSVTFEGELAGATDPPGSSGRSVRKTQWTSSPDSPRSAGDAPNGRRPWAGPPRRPTSIW